MAHASDRSKHLYSIKQLETVKTHDTYWKEAMKEMTHTGYMHNYMRMYWAKKVIEWTPSPEKAFKTLVYLNNKYFLDGRDPIHTLVLAGRSVFTTGHGESGRFSAKSATWRHPVLSENAILRLM